MTSDPMLRSDPFRVTAVFLQHHTRIKVKDEPETASLTAVIFKIQLAAFSSHFHHVK